MRRAGEGSSPLGRCQKSSQTGFDDACMREQKYCGDETLLKLFNELHKKQLLDLDIWVT